MYIYSGCHCVTVYTKYSALSIIHTQIRHHPSVQVYETLAKINTH